MGYSKCDRIGYSVTVIVYHRIHGGNMCDNDLALAKEWGICRHSTDSQYPLIGNSCLLDEALFSNGKMYVRRVVTETTKVELQCGDVFWVLNW